MKKFLFPLFVLLALSFVLISCESEPEEPKYTVTFKDVDGSVISSVSVKGGGEFLSQRINQKQSWVIN